MEYAQGYAKGTDVSDSLDLGTAEMSRVAFPHLNLVHRVAVLDMAGRQLLVFCRTVVQRHDVYLIQC
jgi:hypothetical protein